MTADFPESELIGNRLAHPCMPQPASQSLSVWRYMDLAKLITLLRDQSLYLTRIDQFSDPYEGTTTAGTAEGIREFLRIAGAKDNLSNILQFYESLRACVFVSCWHANEHESEAMWRLYAGGEGGVAIRTSYAKLVRAIEKHQRFYVGEVQYIDYSTTTFPDANTFRVVMHKRSAFSHEREIRIVHDMGQPITGENPLGVALPIDLADLCEEIYVAPTSAPYYFEAVKSIVEALSPSLTHRLKWSLMATPPVRLNTYPAQANSPGA